jgi:hypothetical protein
MARFLLLIGVLALCSISVAVASDDFRIKSLRETRSTDLILVDRNWVKDPKRLLVTLRVESDMPTTGVNVRAYFFDKDGKEVARVEKPNPIWTSTSRGVEEVGLPSMLEKNKDIVVYFALTQELEAKKWKSVVVVFGNDTLVSARSFPATAITTLEFPEKARMIKDQN